MDEKLLNRHSSAPMPAATASTSRERLDQLLAEFGKVTELSGLGLSEEGHCVLVFDKTMTVVIGLMEPEGDLMLSCVVADYRDETELGVLRMALGANVGWAGTGGATLGANTDERYLVLQYREPVEPMEWGRFCQLLQGFLNTVEVLREQIRHLEAHPAPVAAVTGAPPAELMPPPNLRA